MTGLESEICDRCGGKKRTEAHDRICEGSPFEGVCPMCGETYESYTNHLGECDPDR